MDTGALKKFAQAARRQLREQVAAKLEQVLTVDSAEIREKAKAVKDLEKQMAQSSKDAVIERVAYIWFNRFCALRFMDVNRYTRIGTVSPAEGFTQPEILQEAKQGHIDDELERYLNRQRIFDLLDGRLPSVDPQQEAYRYLLVAACNRYYELMPFMFERIADYTELLMPDDLLSESSVLHAVREAMTPEACRDVEVIGWLYQFYISEKKDEVFEGLKKNKKITPDNIPAATQLFTPHWIVRYLVENSLGRLWMLNRPNSRLAERMDYYIRPEQEESDFIRVASPEELKICDPACGSGHMLVYAFDLLHAIYEEEGYDAPEIPRLILENNLYGIEIDERAGELAAFALFMKARRKYRRFFRKPVQPNVCVLENIVFRAGQLKSYMDELGPDLFSVNLQNTLHQFREADNFGSLIRPAVSDAAYFYRTLQEKNVAEDMFLHRTHQKVLKVLKQADYLSPRYHVVIANPPYMGGKGMNGRLKSFAQDNYPASKSDLFAMFIERGFDLIIAQGYNAMVTMQSWMFLSSYEKMRNRLLNEVTIDCMVHMANMVMGIAFGTAATVWHKLHKPDFKGHFSYVYYEDLTDENKPFEFPVKNERLATASAVDFQKIPGSPIAYWVLGKMRDIFIRSKSIKDIADVKHGLSTGKNEAVVRLWSEVSYIDFGLGFNSRDEALESNKKWFPYNKGGNFRKWYGNCEFILRYDKYGNDLMASFSGHRHDGKSHYFKNGVTWTFISSSRFAARYTPNGFVFDVSGSSLFVDHPIRITAFLCTDLCFHILKALNPTLNFQVGNLKSLPIEQESIDDKCREIDTVASKAVSLSREDWDSYETSWDFTNLPLLKSDYRRSTFKATYTQLREHWREMTLEMQRLEVENNRIFIDAYGLQDELTPEVPLDEITLTCNPHYRYGNNKSEEELEALLLADTMKEFISYAVGCMFGRYSLDQPGLILANQGEIADDYRTRIPEPTFELDEDNVIPLLDGDWFTDDISERFRRFLRITFGEEDYEENLSFIEQAIGKDIRKYFLKDFYNDHVRRYKKRPIYWMFSSPKGSFNALIYMHRYRPDTVSMVLNDYLREFRTKLSARRDYLEQISISSSASQREKTQALKEIEKLKKVIDELDGYERDVLYPLATRQVEIDLDDGVKVNYNKIGKALKKITGLSE